MCCVVSVQMTVNTKHEVKPVQNVVATIFGQKDSGLSLYIISLKI